MSALSLLNSLIKTIEPNDADDQKCGGFNDSSLDEMVIAAANAVKQAVIEKAKFAQIKVYEPIKAKKQVVAGVNYCIKIKVDVDAYIHVNVFGSLDRKHELKGICFDKKLDDPLDFSEKQLDKKEIANGFIGKRFYSLYIGNDPNGVYKKDVNAIADVYRAVYPPAMMTMDYNENRLNIFMEKGTDKITKVTWA